MSYLPNALSLSRLLLAALLLVAVQESQWWVAASLFAAAAITDLADGYLARRLGIASPLGGVIDHTCDAIFVTVALAALAAQALLHWLLPVLIPLAFIQYVVDSRIWAGLALRASFLGRWNGVAYFVLAGYAIGVLVVGDEFLLQSVGWLAWVLIGSTVLSMLDRLLAVLRVVR